MFRKMIVTGLLAAVLMLSGITASASDLEPIGNCKLTFYCDCASCSEGWGSLTSTGTYAEEGRTIAVDPDIIPYGSTVYIEGWGYYVAEDCGGGVNGNHIDIYRDSHATVEENGVQYADVYIVK